MLEVDNIFFSYGEENILKGATFYSNKNTITGILGQNGTGKTTLIKCINGMLKPDKGNIILNNNYINKMNIKEIARNVATVSQGINMVYPYSVINIVLMGRIWKLGLGNSPSEKDKIEAKEILNKLSLGELWNKSYNQLSGGQKQLVLIARAIFQNSKIILLDEPTASLDYKNQVFIMELLQDLVVNEDKTVVINIHDPNIALNYCNNIIMLKNGEIIQKGKTAEVLSETNLSSLYDMKIKMFSTEKGKRVVVPY